MDAAQITFFILKKFKDKTFLLWMTVLTVISTAPLIANYLFSKGIEALETHQPLSTVFEVFAIYFAVLIMEHGIRLLAKTKLGHLIEKIIINMQEDMVDQIKETGDKKRKIIQSIRNLSRGIEAFVTDVYEKGVAGFVSFISVPFILLIIDKKIFWVEISLIGIYLALTYYFGKRYERQFERYNEARERYYLKLPTRNFDRHLGYYLSNAKDKLQRIRFQEWTTLQTLITVFQLIVTGLIIIDISNGQKTISDLVLIIGYTAQSKLFLNAMTGNFERYMQIVAGIDRLVITTNGAKPGSITKLF